MPANKTRVIIRVILHSEERSPFKSRILKFASSFDPR